MMDQLSQDLKAASTAADKLLTELARYKRLEALLEDHSDVVDGPDGEQHPNAAMSFLTQWRGPQ